MTRYAIVALALALGCAGDAPMSPMSGGSGGLGGTGAISGGSGGQAGVNASGGAGGADTAGSAGTLGGAGGVAGAMASGGMGGGAASDDAAVDDAALPMSDAGTFDTRMLDPGPSYMGSGGGGCNTAYASIGHAPVDDGAKHPLFLYFVGTSFSADDQSSKHTSPAALAVTEAMARRGFVALSVQYDNSLSLDLNKAGCLYGADNAQSMLAVACALPEVDCELGIATWGHSQGALMAHAASTYDSRVRACWTTGYGGSGQPLSPTRLRVVNGENDAMNSEHARLNEAAGFSDSECPDDGRDSCLRDDGSGWIVVRADACESNSADHCWFDKASCISNAISLEPAWVEIDSSAPFALEANADWVAQTVARP